MRNIYFFSHALTRKNGGGSSLIDLANAFSDMGYEVKFFTPLGFLDKLLYKPSNVHGRIDLSVLDSRLYSRKKLSKPRFIASLFMKSMLFSLKKNSIVIDGIGLPHDYIKRLRENDCSVIFNHAGSVNAFIKFFGIVGRERTDLKHAREEYLNNLDIYSYILFQSKSQAKELMDVSKWKIDKCIVLKPSVSEIDVEEAKKATSIFNDSDFNVVIVGSVQKRKGQHLLPIISRQTNTGHKNIVYHIIGNVLDINYKRDIELSAIDLGQEQNIIFHGFKPNHLEYMSNANLVLQLSEEEGVSRVLREAMALGKAIVSFRLDGSSDLLIDGHDALLCDYGDIDDICFKINAVIHERSLCNRLGSAALDSFRCKYSYGNYKNQLIELINSFSKE